MFEKIWDPTELNGEGNKQLVTNHDKIKSNDLENIQVLKQEPTRELTITPDFENDFKVEILSDSKLKEKSINRKKTLGGKMGNRISTVKLI